MRLGPLQYFTVLGITAAWACGSLFFAAIFVSGFPQYALLGYSSAMATAVVIGLLHLGMLALMRRREACYGMLIAKAAALPVTYMAGFFALAMGAMGTDSGREAAAQSIAFLVPFCMALACLPTTLAALVGTIIGQIVGGVRERSAYASAGRAAGSPAGSFAAPDPDGSKV